MNFGEAIEALKAGKWAARDGWNGKGMHVYLEDGHRFKIRAGVFKGQERVIDPALYLYTAQGTHQPGWNASQADMLAEDWQVIEPT